MSATKIGNRGVPLPRISRIRAFPDFRVSVIWAEGSRTGAADTVDLAPVINTHKFYRPLRKNKKLFRTVHLVDDGHAIAWGDGTIDMSAELIEDIADQAMFPKDFAPRVVALAWYGHEARQKASNPASSLSAQGEGGRTGWLSEVLSRASQDEPAPGGGAPAHDPDAGTPHTVESLDAAAVDIARMVDHDAAADLWSDRNVFTRMLYTMQGQKAFEEVRRKYRRDRDFMRTVDCYIGEFERLLGDVSCDYHGQVLARTYLTSEMGKVYTMLAHAAGRFD
jgi:hypothetical protein